ncbi:hypothetical protein Q7371_05080 [Glaesserella parasuis]|nr:hypothetical protein [Glaesserella parasuis]
MAKEGVQNLSTHKIAKEAGGSIFILRIKRLCLISLCCICLIRFTLR